MGEFGGAALPLQRPLIGTSWKMNLTRAEAREYLRTLRVLLEDHDSFVFVLPPYTSIAVAEAELNGARILYGAQDVSAEPQGAHTGDVAAEMLAELGCWIVEIGHSERRRDHFETDELIGRKARAIIGQSMWPLLCVGESAADREAGREEDVVERQLIAALGWMEADDLARTIVAYEPWWAIGVGATAAPLDHVARLHAFIGRWLARAAGAAVPPPVLYGGSVDLANAQALLSLAGVDGLFVGRAALDPRTFAQIVGIGTQAKHPQSASQSIGGG